MQEAFTVKKYLSEMPSIPKKAGEIYHIAAIDWFNNWKKYTFYNKVLVNS